MDQRVLASSARRRLAKLLRSNLPDASAALITGSAICRPAELVEDIDLIAFVRGGTGEKSVIGRLDRYKVEVTTYDPLIGLAFKKADYSGLLFFREVLRLKTGRVLFGGTAVGAAKRLIEPATLPREELLSILKSRCECLSSICNVDELLLDLETTLICAGYLDGPHGPVKPKWYVLEAEKYYHPCVLYAVRSVLTALGAPDALSLVVSEDTSLWPPVLASIVQDINRLLGAGRLEDARVSSWMLITRLARERERTNAAFSQIIKRYDAFLKASSCILDDSDLKHAKAAIKFANFDLINRLLACRFSASRVV